MSRLLTVKDGYSIINAIAAEMLGDNATVTAVDTSSFVSVGETLLAAGTENVMNTLSLVLNRTLVAIRPYKAKFSLFNSENNGMYSNRMRKISYYAKKAVPTGASNTDLYTNLALGKDNGTNSGTATESMWLQSGPIACELNFGGSTEWQYPYTIYENQLKIAFSNEAEWVKFLNGYMTSVSNDLETEKEAFSRMTLLNYMAGIYDLGNATDMNGSAINMTKAYNDTFGTTYNTSDLLTTHFTEFLEFFVETVKTVSDMLTNRSTNYHLPFTKQIGADTYELPRHTPKANQKMLMVSRFWNAAEARVKPAIFNDQYLTIDNFEKVDYWQNINEPYALSVTPAIPDTTDPTEQTAGDAVALDTVLGVLFDEDALMVDFHLDSAVSSPVEARKHYRTVWNTINKNAINDFSENGILFYMEDED